jgi:hypothetical protein
MSATLSQSRSASSMKWVASTIVIPLSRTLSIRPHVSGRGSGSSPPGLGAASPRSRPGDRGHEPGNAAAANRDGRRPAYSPRRRRRTTSSCPRNDELMVIPPGAGLSLRARQRERSSPDAHEPGRERAAVADPGGDGRASPSCADLAEAVAPATVAAGQFLDAWVGRAPAGARGFPAESCSRCPQARSPRSGRGCAPRGGTRAAPRRSCGSIDGGSSGPWRSWHGRGGARRHRPPGPATPARWLALVLEPARSSTTCWTQHTQRKG